MRVRVTEIESARGYKDGQRRITIKIDEPNAFYKNELLLPESALGLGRVELDEEFEVILSRALPGPHEMTSAVADAVETGRKTQTRSRP
jgi:hypothetical protein